MSTMFPQSVKCAALFLVLTHSVQVLGQCRQSPCSVIPRLIAPSPASKEPAFAFPVSLPSYSPAESSATDLNPTPKAELPDLYPNAPFQSVTNATISLDHSLAERWRNATLEISPITSLPPLLVWLRGWRMEKDDG